MFVHGLKFFLNRGFIANAYCSNAGIPHSRKQFLIPCLVQSYLNRYPQSPADSSLVIRQHPTKPYRFVPLLAEEIINDEKTLGIICLHNKANVLK